ncbi:hypothetical protein [Spongiactinospora rosea]|nr:hypothetical protein [Spongiactinospora rosea]
MVAVVVMYLVREGKIDKSLWDTPRYEPIDMVKPSRRPRAPGPR